MSSDSDSKRGQLPFEPRKNKKKKPAKNPPAASKQKTKGTSRNSRNNSNLSAIPDVVSRRMGKRMAVFCGIPSALGMSSLFICYWLKIKNIVELPPYLALAVSFGFLGLGVVGLSYGLFSACWDEDRAGSLMGLDEFKVNIARTKTAWKESKKANG